MARKQKFRWNFWHSKKKKEGWFYKHGDRREKQLPPDAKIVKHYYSDSYNKVWPRCYNWIEQNMH